MKRRDVVLAVAVLSFLAGLLAVGYAQNRDEPEPLEVEEIRVELQHAINTASPAALRDMLRTQARCTVQQPLIRELAATLHPLEGVARAKAEARAQSGAAPFAGKGICNSWKKNADACWKEHMNCVDNRGMQHCEHIMARCEMWEDLIAAYCHDGGWPV